jgi:hypothetical protein
MVCLENMIRGTIGGAIRHKLIQTQNLVVCAVHICGEQT